MGIFFIIYCTAYFFVLLVTVKIIGCFYEKRRTSFRVMLLSVLPAYLIVIYVYFFIHHDLSPLWFIVEMLIAFAGYFIITLNYQSSLAKRFVVAGTIQLLWVFSATVISTPLFLFTELVGLSDEYLSIYTVLSIPSGYLMALFLRRFKNIRKNAVFPRIALIVPLSGAVFIVGFIFVAIAHLLGISILEEIATFVFVVLLFGFIFLVIYLYDTLAGAYEDGLKMALHEQEKEYYFAQCQLMHESVEKVKSMRHDMKTHLAALSDFTAGNAEAAAYINRLLGDIAKSEVYSETGNIAFDSIINFKLKNARENNIKLDIKLAVPPALNVEMADIVTILGNLLDNALKAVEKAAEKLIKIDIEFGKGGLFIKIDNSFDGIVKYAEDENGAEKRITSSKEGDGNGYGFKIIRQCLEKYNGYMKIAHTENIFSAGVFLYVGE